FRNLSNVLCLIGALSTLASAREQSAALLYLPVQPFHACRRANSVCPLCAGELALTCRRGWMYRPIHRWRHPRLRSIARAHHAPRRNCRCIMKHWIIAGLAVVSLHATAIAMDARHPDWPCPQIVVPKLSIAAFWTGPDIDDIGDAWMKDPTIQGLVVHLAGRIVRACRCRSGETSYIRRSSG